MSQAHASSTQSPSAPPFFFKLTGPSNWVTWRDIMDVWAESCSLANHLDGTSKMPTEDGIELLEWKSDDGMVTSVLLLNMSDDLTEALKASGWTKDNTAHKLIETIEKVIHLSELSDNVMKEFFDLKAHYFPTLEGYIHRLEDLWICVRRINSDLPETFFVLTAIKGIELTHPSRFRQLLHDWQMGRRPTIEDIVSYLNSLRPERDELALLKELFTIRAHQFETLKAYIDRLEWLWAQLRSLRNEGLSDVVFVSAALTGIEEALPDHYAKLRHDVSMDRRSSREKLMDYLHSLAVTELNSDHLDDEMNREAKRLCDERRGVRETARES
ncbi:hypothetical protein CDD80_2771 [Ophiocordyceps camponoti-rufipedis]|uniref:Uncharacterized protein n=1 Tax=Ophiocordyceps camponoti-rufipedis TaxID=2004952 RepID=A0A2C5XJR6_9HYPO|nr:hypothetical protein CDD80_2771 [Ophiocordyceps camponoti-rufipedis]